MRIPDNSGDQSAVSGVAEAEVASLFSEARGWAPFGFGGHGVRALAENASLSSEATARCSGQDEAFTAHGVGAARSAQVRMALPSSASESMMNVAELANDARQSDEATEQGDEADER